MTAAKKLSLVSEEEYLSGELASTIKHEYLGGFVYAMSGARVAHNVVAVNLVGSLHARLKGKPCRPYGSDMKIRIPPPELRFYYPDASVICRSNPAHSSFQEQPVVIFEVLSRGTRRIDEGEKKDAYLSLPSLLVYALVEQDSAAVAVYRRAGSEFVREVYDSPNAVIPLPEIDTELPLADIYDGIEFVPEPEPE